METIDKNTLSERDICTKYITQAIVQAGWNLFNQIQEEVTFTKGRVMVKGRIWSRGESKRTDFLLSYKPNIPVAIIEAKDNNHGIGDGMQQALVNENGDFVAQNRKYVMRITGDNEEGKKELDNFILPESLYPVIATTSKLMNTGVDAQTCKLIVIDQRIQSMTVFKQIIGRGTRINEDFDKYYFTIMDFKKATELFADPLFDGDPVVVYKPVPHDPPVPPDEPYDNVKRSKFVVNDVPVKVVAERVQYYGKDGKLITESLKDYTRNKVRKEYVSLDSFLTQWSKAEKKNLILQELEGQGLLLDALAEQVGRDCDPFDLICHVVYDKPPLSRRETADLFLLLIMHLLKEGGRGAIVLPDGTLFGEGVKNRIKEKLLEECNLHTIVRLPNGVFSPYTGIKTNLLFFTKGTPTKEIWFYEHPYPNGVKSYNKTKPIRIEEFEPEKAWWHKREKNERAWKVSIDEIKAGGYNLDIKNPSVMNNSHRDPEELLAEYRKLLTGIAETRNALKNELKAALEVKSHIKFDTFFDNFELLADAPNGVKKLRELILQLAVRGKLMPQDPTDESVSELLKRIHAVKRYSIAKKKFKKEEPLTSIQSNGIPYKAPIGWEWVRLGDISERIHYGYTASADASSTAIRMLRITDIQDNQVNWNTVPGCQIDDLEFPKYELHQNDILIARTGGTIGKTFLVEKISAKAVFASYLIRVVPSPLLSAKYLKLFLESPLYWDQIRANSAGTGQPNVNGVALSNLLIAFPPVEVELEITEGDTFDSKLLKKEIDDAHIKVIKIKSNIAQVMKEFRIHKGEASAYMLFNECKAKVILTDDGELIKLCKLFKIPFINALAIIVRMYEKGTLTQKEACDYLKKLNDYGRYSKEIYNYFKKEVNCP